MPTTFKSHFYILKTFVSSQTKTHKMKQRDYTNSDAIISQTSITFKFGFELYTKDAILPFLYTKIPVNTKIIPPKFKKYCITKTKRKELKEGIAVRDLQCNFQGLTE